MAICEKLFELSQVHPVLSKVVEDRTALQACISFARDHRILVEPACGAVLSALYAGLLKEDLVRINYLVCSYGNKIHITGKEKGADRGGGVRGQHGERGSPHRVGQDGPRRRRGIKEMKKKRPPTASLSFEIAF